MSKKANKAKLAPTLIIGLGGTGCEIASRVDKLTNEEQRKFVRFVHFDTDANELRMRREETPYIKVVQTSSRLTVGQALRNDREARENSFPSNLQLLNKPLTEGAGQVRSISKLAFDACVREGRIAPLHEAIDELQKLNGDSMAQAMRVVIVSTLVGGTGSGILLPLSMYLRHYLENTCQKKPIIRGVCVLPDVFFHGGNKTETEKNNLRANAYATLRELDAFMLKADSANAAELSKKFWLKMPTPGTVDEYDDYSLNPMDFCFLFDGQNQDGDGLQTFSMYKQHVADCIYASSISMLNKRLNSSEDNTILQRCAENGRNRYCGFGTSKIVYPFKDVRDYIAMTWMNQSMTTDWLRYDKQYEEKLVKQQISRSQGVMLPPIDRRKFYCDSVTSDQGEHNSFALSLFEECHNKDRLGISFTTPRWESYYDKLKAFIDDKVSEDVGYDEGIADNIEKNLNQMSQNVDDKDVQSFKGIYMMTAPLMKTYFSITKRHAEATAGVVADSVFSPNNFDTSNEHHIEHWLTQNGIPLHPNSTRFFLYSLEMLLKEEKRRLSLPTKEDDFEAEMPVGEEDPFGNESFADLEKKVKNFFEVKDNIVESKSGNNDQSVNIDTYVASFRGGLLGKNSDLFDKMNSVVSKCRDHCANIRRYYAVYLRLTIINAALDYIDKLCNNYEYFFQQLDTEIKRLPRRIQRIEETYQNSAGNPVIYACASGKCLEGLVARCPNTVDSIALTPEFRQALFKGIFETLKVDGVDKQRAVIDDLVNEDILEFWRGEAIGQYGKKIDMDIIDALRTQAELEKGLEDAEEQRYFIEGIANEAKKLAAPFIDRPIGQEPYIIDACGMGAEVSSADDMLKASIIARVFDSREADEYMDKYQILYLKALYNLKICDLPKFAPADNNSVDPHNMGDYYKAYWKRIDSIIPDSMKTRVLTPHLDKRWHFIGVMPDLSDESEKRCIAEAHAAFVSSIFYGWVKYDRDIYRFLDKKGDFISDDIIVEDGRCNKLSEIYQAMLMNRPLVLDMLNRFKEETGKETSNSTVGNRDYTHTKLYKVMKDAHIFAFNMIPRISVFELPLLCKVTAGSIDYKSDDAIVMLENIMKYIENYLKVFYNDDYIRNEYYVKWLREEMDKMLDNLATVYETEEYTIIANPCADEIVKRTINIVLNTIRSYEYCPAAKDIAEEIETKWKAMLTK